MSTKFEKILCPVEFESNSAAALRFACELAQSESRRYILHVLPAHAGPGAKVAQSTVELAGDCLRDFASEQGVSDLQPQLLIRTGNPAEIIVNIADELMVDVIVMATHGRKGFARFVLGGVAERVVRQARPPVLTIRPEIRGWPKSE